MIQIRKFALLLLWTVIGFTVDGKAGSKGGVHLYGHVSTDREKLQLSFYIFPHHLSAVLDSGIVQEIDVPVDAFGRFSIDFPSSDPGRITVEDRMTSSMLLSDQLFEPGDSVELEAKVVVDSRGSRFIANISGVGAEKYKCEQALGLSYDNDWAFRLVLYNLKKKGIYEVADSILSSQLNILDRFRARVSIQAYQVMKADILGSVYGKMVFGLFGGIGKNFFHKSYDDTTLSSMRAKLAKFSEYSKTDLPSKTLAMSEFFVDFIYQKARVELAYNNPTAPFGLNDFCGQLERDAEGDLRSVCFSYLLFDDNNVRYSVDTAVSDEEFTSCLERAEAHAELPWVRALIREVRTVRGKGATAFDFCLPSDSTGHLVRLSDFRGKVVLLDMWGYECTACTLFTQAFHKAVFPLFKGNPDFKVISIMTSPATMEKYMYRLRGTVNPKYGARLATYTYPDYVNLFAGRKEGITLGQEIIHHYLFNSSPGILLIDKYGRIFSSQVPFFMDPDSDNVAKLTALIREALQE